MLEGSPSSSFSRLGPRTPEERLKLLLQAKTEHDHAAAPVREDGSLMSLLSLPY